jgi:hypothetical protein
MSYENQTSPWEASRVIFLSSPSNHTRVSLKFRKNHLLQTFHRTPSVQTIFVFVNSFSFQTLVLSSSFLSMTLYLHRTHVRHVFFHSLHFHLIIWGHLLTVQILFLTLIKSATIWLLSYALLLTRLIFEVNCSETILWPIPLPFDLLSLYMHLLVHFEACHPYMWLCFEP